MFKNFMKKVADKRMDVSKHGFVKKFKETKDKSHLKELYSSDDYVAQYQTPKIEWLNKFKMIIELMEIKPGESVLDIGCTTKLFKPYVENVEGKYFSFDVSSKFKPDFLGDAENMHMIKDGQFDWVVAADVLEHLPNPKIALKEIHRIAKRVIISLPNWYHFDCLSFLPSNPYDRHLTKQTAFKWKRMCKQAGFKVRRVSGLNYTLDIPTYNIKFLLFLNKIFNNKLSLKISDWMNKYFASLPVFKYLGQTVVLVLEND